MDISNFTQQEINGCVCHLNADYMLVQNTVGTWNAYKRERDKFGILTGNLSAVMKEVIGQEYDDEYNLVDVLGAKEYATPEEAAMDCAVV